MSSLPLNLLPCSLSQTSQKLLEACKSLYFVQLDNQLNAMTVVDQGKYALLPSSISCRSCLHLRLLEVSRQNRLCYYLLTLKGLQSLEK